AWTGGEIVILNPRMPIKCPPAPYEVAFLLHHELSARDLLAKTKLAMWTVEPAPMPTAGPEVAKVMKEALAARGIAFNPGQKPRTVAAAKRAVLFGEGTEAKSALLIAVPPPVLPKAVRESGLAGPSGWIPVDAKTLATSHDGVWAMGDAAGVPLPGRYKPDVP